LLEARKPASADTSVEVSEHALKAMTQKELFEKAGIIAMATGQRALKQLLAEGKIDRIGRGIKGDPCRYWAV